MTKLESIKCEKLLNEAIEYAIDAKDKLDVAARHPNATERYVLENTAHNHRGYAEGINPRWMPYESKSEIQGFR